MAFYFIVSMISGSWNTHNFRQKFHILLILTGKMHQNGLSGAYFGFKACQIQWHLFQVPMISGSWKIKILGGKYHKMGLKTIKMEWDLCSSPPWVPFYPYTMFQNPMPKPSCQKSRKTIITQKVLVTQSSNIVHCDQHTQKPISVTQIVTFCCIVDSVTQCIEPMACRWFKLYTGFKACTNWHRFTICM